MRIKVAELRKLIKEELELTPAEEHAELVNIGLKFVPREPVKFVRGSMSSAHGSHPFAGSGGGGSGFSSDRSGPGFTSYGGGPGAVGGGYEWRADDPRNLSMGSKRK